MSAEDFVNFELEVDLPDSTEEERSELGFNLLRELKGNPNLPASLREGGIAPVGTKTGGVLDYGAIAIAVLPTAVPSLITLVQGWVERGRGGRTVKFKVNGVEYEGPREDAEKFLAWIESQKKNKKNKKK